MKTEKIFSLFVLAAALLHGCIDEEDAGDLFFAASPAELSFDGDGSSATLTVSGTMPWKVYSIPSWCSLEPSEGCAGRTGVTVTATGYSGEGSRGGYVELIDEQGLILSVLAVRGLTDREVLMILYESTGGDAWLDNTNWGSDRPLDEWAHVYTDAGGRVVKLALNDNNLTGTLPPQICKLHNMTDLQVSGNDLTGPIPAGIGELCALQIFSCGSNRLTGPIPFSMGSLTNLSNVYMSSNQFEGTLPASLGNLTELIYLSVDHNNIEGDIPASLGNLTRLSVFNVSLNRMTGEVPQQVMQLPGWDRFVSSGWINPQQQGYGLVY